MPSSRRARRTLRRSAQADLQESRLHGREPATTARLRDAAQIRLRLHERLRAAGDLGLAAEGEARRLQVSEAQIKRLLADLIDAELATYRADTDRYIVTWRGLKPSR